MRTTPLVEDKKYLGDRRRIARAFVLTILLAASIAAMLYFIGSRPGPTGPQGPPGPQGKAAPSPSVQDGAQVGDQAGDQVARDTNVPTTPPVSAPRVSPTPTPQKFTPAPTPRPIPSPIQNGNGIVETIGRGIMRLWPL